MHAPPDPSLNHLGVIRFGTAAICGDSVGDRFARPLIDEFPSERAIGAEDGIDLAVIVGGDRDGGGSADEIARFGGNDERETGLLVIGEEAGCHVGIGGVEEEETAELGVIEDGRRFRFRGPRGCRRSRG